MNINEYLQKHQPVIYKSFCNALKFSKLSHAYLLVGNPGTPLMEVARYLAKTLICDDPHPLACNNCITCMRVDDGNFADMIIVDGSKETIKKPDVQHIIETFDKKALEAKGKQIYIIHQVENMTAEAVNSLLKFLEEPGKEIYAFLTTENEMKVLPTIISRTQKLVLRPISQHDVIKDARLSDISSDDAEVLSFFFSDASLIKEMSENNDFMLAKECAFNTIENLSISPKAAVYYIQKDVISSLKNKESVRLYLDILSIMLEEILKIKDNSAIILESYGKILTKLSTTLENVDDLLLEIMVTRGRIDLNITLSLLLDHIAKTLISKGGK